VSPRAQLVLHLEYWNIGMAVGFAYRLVHLASLFIVRSATANRR